MKSNIVANGKMKDWRSRKCMTAEQNTANFVCGVRLTLSCPRSFWAHLVDFFPERRFSKRYSYSFDSFSTKHFFKFLMTVLKCYLQKFWNFKFWEKKDIEISLNTGSHGTENFKAPATLLILIQPKFFYMFSDGSHRSYLCKFWNLSFLKLLKCSFTQDLDGVGDFKRLLVLQLLKLFQPTFF